MEDDTRGERALRVDAETPAAYVREIMAECRARLAAEDAARERARAGQQAEEDVVERPATD